MANIELTEQDLVYISIALAREIVRSEAVGPSLQSNVSKLTEARVKIVETLKREYPKDYDG